MKKTFAETRNGRIAGFLKKKERVFLGVPYAEPPLGGNRFRSPRPPRDWEGVLDCTHNSRIPLQNPLDSHQSEDCLYLNIWDPDPTTAEKPVLFWLYGGAFMTGGNGKGEFLGIGYDGFLFARDSGCVIVVPNYRENVFGFLDFSNFDPSFERNLGFKDVLQALKWVQGNIAHFGGDPGNVTLAGQSAGAALIALLLNCPEAEPLFHKCILESPCLESFYTPEQGARMAERYLHFLGLKKEEAARIKELPYPPLLKAVKKLSQSLFAEVWGICAFSPIVDGKEIRAFPTYADYQHANKPLLIGSNAEEARLFLLGSAADPALLLKKGPRLLDLKEMQRLSLFYPRFPSRKASAALLTDLMYTLPKTHFADVYSISNPVYVYRLDFAGGVYKLAGLGSCHLTEVPLLFGWYDIYLLEMPWAIALAERLRRYFGAFARTGDLTEKGWPLYQKETRLTMILNKKDAVEENPEKAKIDYYRERKHFYC